MDNELRDLKNEFEKAIPTRFTNVDRHAVLKRITNGTPKKEKRYILPRVLTAIVVTSFLMVGGYSLFNLLEIAPVEESDSANLDSDYLVELEPDFDYLTFDPYSLKPEDQIGSFTVTSVTTDSVHTHVTFNGKILINGEVVGGDGNTWFVPNTESLLKLPIDQSDIKNKIEITFSDPSMFGYFYGVNEIDPTERISISLFVNQIDYEVRDKTSTITLSVNNIIEEYNTIETVLRNTFTGPDPELISILENMDGDFSPLYEYEKQLFAEYFTEMGFMDYITSNIGTRYLTEAYQTGYQLQFNTVKIHDASTQLEKIYNFSAAISFNKSGEESKTAQIKGQVNLNEESKIKNLIISDFDGLDEAIER